MGKWSDHKGIECKIRVTILAHTNEGNSPVINYGVDGGWDRYHKISDERAPDNLSSTQSTEVPSGNLASAEIECSLTQENSWTSQEFLQA